MPRAISSKCRECSKLDTPEAKLKDCWDSGLCPDRRYNYRNREKRNYDRKKIRSPNATESKIVLATIEPRIIDSPIVLGVAPMVIYWRETKNSPVHAIGAQLQAGTKVILSAVPRHCLGATEGEIHQWLRIVLQDFRQQHDKPIGKFVRGGIEHHPLLCPLCRTQPDCN